MPLTSKNASADKSSLLNIFTPVSPLSIFAPASKCSQTEPPILIDKGTQTSTSLSESSYESRAAIQLSCDERAKEISEYSLTDLQKAHIHLWHQYYILENFAKACQDHARQQRDLMPKIYEAEIIRLNAIIEQQARELVTSQKQHQEQRAKLGMLKDSLSMIMSASPDSAPTASFVENVEKPTVIDDYLSPQNLASASPPGNTTPTPPHSARSSLIL